MSLSPVRGEVTENDWLRFKEELRRLYLIETRALEGQESVQQEMETRYNFKQNKSQYETHFRAWGFRKNIKRKDWEIVRSKVLKRKRDGKESDVYIYGSLVPEKKLRKELHRYENGTSRDFSVQETPRTPDAVSIHTPGSTTVINESQISARELPILQFCEDFIPRALQASSSSNDGDIHHISGEDAENSHFGDSETVIELLHGMYRRFINSTGARALQRHPPIDDIAREYSQNSLSESQWETHIFEMQFTLFVVFTVSNNLVTDATREIIIWWCRTKKNNFSSVLSVTGTTVDAFVENLFPIALGIGDAEIVEALLDRCIDTESLMAVELDGRKPLEIACITRNLELVKVILATGFNLNDSGGTLLLARAIRGDDQMLLDPLSDLVNELVVIKIAQLLLDAGSAVNGRPGTEYLPLVEAARKGLENLVYVLVDGGANPSLSDRDGKSPLEAVLGLYVFDMPEKILRIVRCLVENGADVGLLPESVLLDHAAKTGSEELWGYLHNACARYSPCTTLGNAVKSGNKNLVRRLLDTGIPEDEGSGSQPTYSLVCAVTSRDLELFQLVFQSASVLRSSDVLVKCIEEAARVGMGELIPQLLAVGEPDKSLPERLTPALKGAVAARNLHLVKLLLDAEVPIDSEVMVTAIQSRSMPILFELQAANFMTNRSDAFGPLRDRNVDESKTHGHSQRRTITPLVAAARCGDCSVIKWLLDLGTDPDSVEPLVEAIRHKDFALVTTLLDAGSHVNGYHMDSFETPLQAAIKVGDIHFTKLLLDYGADPHDCAWGSRVRLPPLAMAVQLQRLDLVELLLSFGANLNDPLAKWNGCSPLATAVFENDLEMTRYFSKFGADPDDYAALFYIVKNDNLYLADYVLDCRSRKYLQYMKGWGVDALHCAVRQQSYDLIDLLLWYGDDPNMPCNGLTALGVAIEVDKSEDLRLVSKLLGASADPNVIVDARNHSAGQGSSKTALLAAIECGSLPLIELLLQHGADINAPARGRIWHTPLQAACKSGKLKVVELLLSRGAEVNAPAAQRNGATALQYAAVHGHLGIASLLLDNGADVNAARALINGHTVLEGALRHHRIDMLQLVLNAGAKIDIAMYGQNSKKPSLAMKYGRIVAKILEGHIAARTLCL